MPAGTSFFKQLQTNGGYTLQALAHQWRNKKVCVIAGQFLKERGFFKCPRSARRDGQRRKPEEPCAEFIEALGRHRAWSRP